MSWVRRILPLPVLLLLLVLAAVQVAMLVAARAEDGRVSGLRVGVVGPALVSQAVAERVAGLPDTDVEAAVVDDAAEGRELLRDGTLDAVVVIDLIEPADRLLVPSWTDADVAAALERDARAVASTYARDLRVQRVDPVRNAGARTGLPYLLAAGWVVVGLALAVVATAIGGPVAPTSRAGVRRLLLIVLASVGTGVLSALALLPVLDGVGPQVALVGGLTVGATAATTFALEALIGLAGIGLSVTFIVGTATPMLTRTGLHEIAAPVRDLLAYTPPWAAHALLEDATYLGTWAPLRSLGVLAGWVLVMTMVPMVARRERPAADVP